MFVVTLVMELRKNVAVDIEFIKTAGGGDSYLVLVDGDERWCWGRGDGWVWRNVKVTNWLSW